MFLHLFVVGLLGTVSILACDCAAPTVRAETRRSAVVFTGYAGKKTEFSTVYEGHHRSEIRFSVKKIWKGSVPSDVSIYDAPWFDCSGFGFEAGKEHVVFAQSRVVTKDIKLRIKHEAVNLRDVWSDVLPIGTTILHSKSCSNTSETTSERGRRIIRHLGNPKRLLP